MIVLYNKGLLYAKVLMNLRIKIKHNGDIFDNKEQEGVFLIPEQVIYILQRNGNIKIWNGEKYIKLGLGEFREIIEKKQYKVIEYIEPKPVEVKEEKKVEVKEEVKVQPKQEVKKEEPKPVEVKEEKKVEEEVKVQPKQDHKNENDNKKQRHNNNNNHNKQQGGDK